VRLDVDLRGIETLSPQYGWQRRSDRKNQPLKEFKDAIGVEGNL
jgi:hypothetical protein